MTKNTTRIETYTGLEKDGNDSIGVKVDGLTLKQLLEVQSIRYSQQQRRTWGQKCQEILSGVVFCTSLSIASFLFPSVCKPASAAPSPSSYASMASRTPLLSSGGAQTTLYEHHVPLLQPTYVTRGLTSDRFISARAFRYGPSSGLRRRKSKSSVTGTRYGDGLRSRDIDHAKRCVLMKLSEFDEHLRIAVEQDAAESTAVGAEDLPTDREGYCNPYWPETVDYDYYKTHSTNPRRFESSYSTFQEGANPYCPETVDYQYHNIYSKSSMQSERSHSPLQKGSSEFEPVIDPTKLADFSLVEEPVEKVHLNSAERTKAKATKSQSGLSLLAQNGCKQLSQRTKGTSLKLSAEGNIGLPWIGQTKAAIQSETLSMVQEECLEMQKNDLGASVIERKANTSKTKAEEAKIKQEMELARAEEDRKKAEEDRKNRLFEEQLKGEILKNKLLQKQLDEFEKNKKD